MCGIFGGVTESQEVVDHLLTRSLCLEHRGPDSEGRFIRNSGDAITFGQHFRLAIQDLSQAAHQPMESASGRHTILFNGEIYNIGQLLHKLPPRVQSSLKSTSDTEVVLELWEALGPQSLDQLEGMFALAIFDWDQRMLHLARDMFGVKPLYFASTESSFSFSSEIEPLLDRSKCQLNARELAEFLAFDRYDRHAETVFRGVFQVPPGGSIAVSFDRLEPEKGPWRSEGIPELQILDWGDSLELVQKEFFRSVELHMISDAPLAFALSGGLDSSAIVCAARILNPHIPIHTFSYISEDPNQTEEYWIDLVNERVGAIAHKVRLRDDKSEEEPFQFARRQGAPFNNVHFYAQYLVFKAARNAGFKVILEGQGGDEILGGYDGFLSARLSQFFSEGRVKAGLTMLCLLDRSQLEKFKIFLSSLLRVMRYLILAETSVANLKFRRGGAPSGDKATSQMLGGEISGRHHTLPLTEGIRGELWRSATWDLLPRILRHGDRNAMAHGVENRVPFLGQRFARTMLSLPDEYLVRSDGLTKNIFREAMRGIVPDPIIDRRDKKGFEAEILPILSRFGDFGKFSGKGFSMRLSLLRIWLRELNR